jgi:hypothetical protein
MGYKEEPFNYCILSVPNTKPLVSAPKYMILQPPNPTSDNQQSKSAKNILLRGDCESKLTIWNIPQVNNSQIMQLKQMAVGEEGQGANEDAQKAMQAAFLPPGTF